MKVRDFCSPQTITIAPLASFRVGVLSAELGKLSETLRWSRKRELEQRRRL